MYESDTLTPDDLNRPDWNSLLQNYSKHDIGEAYLQGRLEDRGFHVEHWGIDRRHEDSSLIFDNKMDLRVWEPLDGQTEAPSGWPVGELIINDDVEEVIHETLTADQVIQLNNNNTLLAGNEPTGKEWRLHSIVDVKTKSNSDWMQKFNLRHLTHYSHWARKYPVPAFVYMTMVDEDEKSVGCESYITRIPEWPYDKLLAHYDPNNSVNLTYGELKDEARRCPSVKRTFRAPDGNLVVTIHEDYWDDLSSVGGFEVE